MANSRPTVKNLQTIFAVLINVAMAAAGVTFACILYLQDWTWSPMLVFPATTMLVVVGLSGFGAKHAEASYSKGYDRGYSDAHRQKPASSSNDAS